MVDLEDITELQKLKIEKGLCDYRYIMNNWKKNDADFQKVYYDFYLKSRWALTKNAYFKKKYFCLLSNIPSDTNVVELVRVFHEDKRIGSYELSIISKMVHTVNPYSPIYDSAVREFLVKKCHLNLWWQTSNIHGDRPKGISNIKKIEHDWNIICEWYERFLNSSESERWLKWFDENFPTYKDDISKVKKIDFIIYATN